MTCLADNFTRVMASTLPRSERDEPCRPAKKGWPNRPATLYAGTREELWTFPSIESAMVLCMDWSVALGEARERGGIGSLHTGPGGRTAARSGPRRLAAHRAVTVPRSAPVTGHFRRRGLFAILRAMKPVLGP